MPDIPGFVELLRRLRIWAGEPSLSALSRTSGIPRTTLYDAIDSRRRTLPSLDLVRRLVRACGADEHEQRAWETAWRRLRANRAAPPVSAGGPTARQLPFNPRGFAGRDNELKLLDSLLDAEDTALAVIVGTAGVGKTALATHWAHRVAPRYPDGQLHVDLQGFGPAAPLAPARALTVLLRSLLAPGEQPPSELDAQIGLFRTLTAGRRMLLLLDNAADVRQVRPILPGHPDCLTLITSRNPLTGLIAHEGAHRVSLERLKPGESRELLSAALGLDRVGREPQASAELAQVCAHLPLALRIAAAHLLTRPMQTVECYVSELRSGDRLAILALDDGDENSISVAFQHSYAVLPAPAARLLRLLGLIAGPDFAADALAALLGVARAESDRLVGLLLAGHLIEPSTVERYRLHDLMRIFANRLVAKDPEHESARDRLLSWYLHTARAAGRTIQPGLSQLTEPPPTRGTHPLSFRDGLHAVEWLDAEQSNLLAMCYAAAAENLPCGWQIPHALRGHAAFHAQTELWIDLLQRGLSAAGQQHNVLGEAAMHNCLGVTTWVQHDVDRAIIHIGRSLELYRGLGDQGMEQTLLPILAMMHHSVGRPAKALGPLHEVLAARLNAADTLDAARIKRRLGVVYRDLGLLEEAIALIHEFLPVLKDSDTFWYAMGVQDLADAYCDVGRLPEAMAYAQECLAIYRQFADDRAEATALETLARICLAAGDHPRAQDLAGQSLRLARAAGDRRIECDTLCTLAAASTLSPSEQRLHLVRALELSTAIGHRYGETMVHIGLAYLECREGAYAVAFEHAQRAIKLSRRTSSLLRRAMAVTAYAQVCSDAGEYRKAVEAGREAADLHRQTGQRLGLAQAQQLLTRARAAASADPGMV